MDEKKRLWDFNLTNNLTMAVRLDDNLALESRIHPDFDEYL